MNELVELARIIGLTATSTACSGHGAGVFLLDKGNAAKELAKCEERCIRNLFHAGGDTSLNFVNRNILHHIPENSWNRPRFSVQSLPQSPLVDLKTWKE